MNERIMELAEQAEWRFADKTTGNFSEYDQRLEKFAELIVRECAKIADVADENKCEWIGGNILTRFGVE